MPDDHVSVVLLMIIVLPAFVPPAKANNGGPFLRKNVCEGTARPFCGIAMFFARKIIFEGVPLLLRLIQPVHVPDPLQVVRAFRPHQINDATVCGNIFRWSNLDATVPFAIPTKPFSVRLRSPLDQDRAPEI